MALTASQNTIEIRIDGKTVAVPSGITALDALRQLGLDVPTLCYDERLAAAGACRACLVRLKGTNRLVTSCALTVSDGMEMEVDTPELQEARRSVLGMLARDYPAAYVEALPEKEFHRHLRKMGIECGEATSDPAEIDHSNPYFRFDPAACIECYRCVRICDEVQGSHVWSVQSRGLRTVVRPDAARLSESSCRSCGACVDVCPSGALVDKTREQQGPAESWTRTTCPYCGVGCELELGVSGNRIVQVLPVHGSPVNKGHLCVKGRYAHGFNSASDRLSQPLLRKNGRLTPATWDEAIRFVAEGFRRILERDGPSAVGVLGSARAPNEDNYLAQKFARVVLGTNNVDCCARVCHGPTAAAMKAMLGTGAATNSFDDIERARTILVSGSNATECHPIVGERILQAKAAGANLIVIDPRRTDLAEVADLHLPVRPGTNIPLLNAIGHTILEEGLADEAFLAERVDQVDEFREFVADFSPGKVSEITGVEASAIRAVARMYASQKPSMCFHGLGMTEHLQGTEGVMALVNLALLTGNMGRPGSGINPLRGQNNVQGSAHMGCEPSNLTGFVSIPDGRERFEAVWNRHIPTAQGLTLMQMIDEASLGHFKALWCIGYDVYFTNANAAATRKAFEAMELVVVQDLFLNETAREFAHVVLPAASPFEREGTFMNAERRVNRVRMAIEPPGEAKADWEIIQLVARQMGYADAFDFDDAEQIWEEIRLVWKPGAGMSYARLEPGGLQWPCPTEDHPGTTVLHRESFPIGKKAALKRISFDPTPEVVSEEYPILLTTGRSLYHFNAGTMSMRTKNAEIRPTDMLELHPDTAAKNGLVDGRRVRIVSRYGTAELPLKTSSRIKPGEAFATFHDRQVFLNLATGHVRDKVTGAPEYKVCAIRVDRAN